jgi:predicted TIM-barrel fold metal-dependent hydrolase
MKWKDIKKIDAHIHLLPKEKLDSLIKYEGHPYIKASVENYLSLMEEYNIEKAVLMPMNDMYFYYKDPDKTNMFFSGLISQYENKFLAFADIVNTGAYFIDDSPFVLEKAINEHRLHGLKIHPTNLHMNADDLKLVPVLRKAADLKVPVMIHSNPCRTGFNDNCSPDRINRMIKVFPDLDIITAHLGGMKYMDAISGCTYVDISYILPVLVKMYGVEQTNRILRMFGPDRIIFGTDFPEGNLETYCNILDQMDFTDEEMHKIARLNICKLLNIDI